MGVEGAKLQLPFIIKVSWVGENAQKQRVEAQVLQPRLDEDCVGV